MIFNDYDDCVSEKSFKSCFFGLLKNYKQVLRTQKAVFQLNKLDLAHALSELVRLGRY